MQPRQAYSGAMSSAWDGRVPFFQRQRKPARLEAKPRQEVATRPAQRSPSCGYAVNLAACPCPRAQSKLAEL